MEIINKFEHEILNLIDSKVEGPYWDFKKKWHDDKGALLHDIMCMANNLEDRDAYIIIGIDEESDFSVVSTVNDINRRNNNQLVTFLRDKKFIGGIRPETVVKTIFFNNEEIDVVIIKNTTHTPYMLQEDFPKEKSKKNVLSYRVYTRINDSNTPLNGNADLDKIEYLWRKRFGLYLPALEKAKLLLSNYEDWIHDEPKNLMYYKYDPNFLIKIVDAEWNNDRTNPNRIRNFYNKLFMNCEGYEWKRYELYYNNIVLYTGECSYNDGGRLLIANPKKKGIKLGHMDYFSYFYYQEDSIEYKVNQIFLNFHNELESKEEYKYISDFIIEFRDEIELATFNSYLLSTKNRLRDEIRTSEKYDLWEQYLLDEWEVKDYFDAKKAKKLHDDYRQNN